MHIVRRLLCFLFFTILHHCHVIFVLRTRPHNKQHRFWLYFLWFIEISRLDLHIFRAIMFLSISVLNVCILFVDFSVSHFFTILHHCYAIFVHRARPHNKRHRNWLYILRFIKINRSKLLVFRAFIFSSISVLNACILFVEFYVSYVWQFCATLMSFLYNVQGHTINKIDVGCTFSES